MNSVVSFLTLTTAWSTFTASNAFDGITSWLWPAQHPIQNLQVKPSFQNSWKGYDVDTNYYDTIPNTGKTVEVWLSIEESTCNQDGYRRPCMTFNGTMPGPTIIADWGDDLIVHVSNTLRHVGTTVHFHGVRQYNSTEFDGVPGVTQCPIAPGQSFIYKFKVTQYGSTWYHSHVSLQYSNGVFGGMIFNGPATANYDEDLGPLFLQDWSHTSSFDAWTQKEKFGITHSLTGTLINCTNDYDCSMSMDANCIGGGRKFEMVFQRGKRYLLRLINVSTDSQFQFSIDNHNLTIIASDFVSIRPYQTDAVIINSAQRYDVIVEASASPGDYWLRGGWVRACGGVANDLPEIMTGIVRYDARSTNDPTSRSTVTPPSLCGDEALENLVPRMEMDVTNIAGTTIEHLYAQLTHERIFQWTINSSSLVLDWTAPTLGKMLNDDPVFPTSYNVVPVDKSKSSGNEWAVLVIENKVQGLLGAISHPIHLHGHDFWILAQEFHPWDGTTSAFNLHNPPRRDTAVLPAHGHLALAFRLDNPGVWLIHCHIAWHATQGLSMEFVESAGELALGSESVSGYDALCREWAEWARDHPSEEYGSGI